MNVNAPDLIVCFLHRVAIFVEVDKRLTLSRFCIRFVTQHGGFSSSEVLRVVSLLVLLGRSVSTRCRLQDSCAKTEGSLSNPNR